jgi:hypothetical protein
VQGDKMCARGGKYFLQPFFVAGDRFQPVL